MVNRHTPRIWGLVTLCLIIVLMACDRGNDSGTSLESSNSNSSRQPTALNPVADDRADSDQAPASDLARVAPSENVLALPAMSSLQGRLIVVQGNMRTVSSSEGDGGKIYLTDFDGGEPQALAARVYAPTVMLSPDQRHLVYTAAIGRHWYIYALDLRTLEITQLIQTPSQRNYVNDWSPNGRYVTVFSSPNRTQNLLALDGSESLVLGTTFSIFTQDDLLLAVGIEGQSQGGGLGTFVEPVTLINPATMESESLSITIVPDAGAYGLIASMRGAGYELSPNVTAAYFAQLPIYTPETDTMLNVRNISNTGQAQVCSVFEFSLQPVGAEEPQAFAQVNDTLLISDVDQVGDVYYFERWYAPDCTLVLETLSVELVRQVLDQDPEVVLTGLYPGNEIGINFLRATTGRKHDFSPDEAYVAWIGGSYQDQTTSLNITRLADGETAQLLTWTSSNANNFLTWEAFNSVFWIP